VLHHGSDWSYFFTEDESEVTFGRDASGRITGATFGADGDVLQVRRINRSASRADSTG
jgi:fumarylacetoacetate (FAA) hydrolase family protein